MGSLVDNIVKWGVGGLNIDECRVAFNGDKWKPQKSGKTSRLIKVKQLLQPVVWQRPTI